MRIELEHWSEAEMDIISAKAVLSVLIDSLHANGADQVHQDAAYGAYRLIESGLSWIDSGMYRSIEGLGNG